MEKEHLSVAAMWNAYLRTLEDERAKGEMTYSSWSFGDSPDELVELVIRGMKTATSSLHLVYSFYDRALPQSGDHSVITDGSGIARCIIRTDRVSMVPYREVTAEFASWEGEGSLEHWRNVHWAFFSGEMARMGEEPSEDMMVVCEEFSLVYPALT